MRRRCWESVFGPFATKSGSTVYHRGGTHNMSSFSTLQTLEGYLKVVTDRQQMITANMANVDTPGYHTKDMNFQSALRQVMYDGTTARLEQIGRASCRERA